MGSAVMTDFPGPDLTFSILVLVPGSAASVRVAHALASRQSSALMELELCKTTFVPLSLASQGPEP